MRNGLQTAGLDGGKHKGFAGRVGKPAKRPSVKKWRAEAFAEVKAILEAIEERRLAKSMKLSPLAKLAARGVASWHAWRQAVKDERLDYMPNFDTVYAFARTMGLTIGLKPDVTVDGSGTTLTPGGAGRHMYSETRKLAALMQQLPEQARKDILEYAQSYRNTWVKPPVPEAPANPPDPAAKD